MATKRGRFVRDLVGRIGGIAGPVFGLLAMIYFGYHAFQGDRGLIAWWSLRFELAQAKAELAEVRAEKAAIEHRVRLLRPDSLDPDMLEERARIMLGSIVPGELVVPDAMIAN
jgi:cell division protein FtsB